MSDWQVGDLAVCVDVAPREGNRSGAGWALREGGIYKVSGLHINQCNKLCLLVDSRFDPWRENRFRKIRPDEAEACEPEFVTLLKRVKRTVIA